MKKIRNASIDLTYKCNFRCLHCFNSSGEHKNAKKELSDDELFKVSQQVGQLAPDTLCLCGGETMLRKEMIYKICREIKNHINDKVNITTVSNGYLITETVVKELKDSRLDLIQISLDGATEETHDWLRDCPGSFKKAINALELLKKFELSSAVAYTPTKRNFKQVNQAIDLAYKLGVKSFRVQPVMKLGRARDNLNQYFLSYQEYMQLRHTLKIKAEEYSGDNTFQIEWGDPTDHLRYGIQKNSGLYTLTVSAYGELLISPYLPISFGNVRNADIEEYYNSGLMDVWQNPIIKKIVPNIRSAEHMDVAVNGLPEIFVGEIIDLDILNPNYQIETQRVLSTIK